MLGLLVKFGDLGRGLGSDPPTVTEGRTLAAPREEPSLSPTVFLCVCLGGRRLGSLPFLGAGTHASSAGRRLLEGLSLVEEARQRASSCSPFLFFFETSWAGDPHWCQA